MSIIETPRNASEKTLACLVVDRSGSMAHDIGALNDGVKSFLEDIRDDPRMASSLEVAVVAFDDQVQVLHEPDLAETINYQNMNVGGLTALVDAVRKGIEVVEERKNYYKAHNIKYKLPWIVVMTDGYETEKPNELSDLAQEIESLTKKQKFMLMPIAVTQDAFKELSKIAGYKKTGSGYQQVTPVLLGDKKFSEFFEWLSASMSAIANSGEGEDVSLQNPVDAGWGTFPTM